METPGLGARGSGPGSAEKPGLGARGSGPGSAEVVIDQVPGIVVGLVGPHRLAFAAAQVTTIEVPGSREVPDARTLFGLEATGGRILVAETGDSLAVDSVEIHQDQFGLLASPPMLGRGPGGSLRGFVTVSERLCPLFRLAEFSRFVATSEVQP